MTTVKYLRRKNNGNYEHEEFEISIPVESVDKKIIYTEAQEVRELVISLLNGAKTLVASEKPVTKAKKEEVQMELPIKEEVKEEVKAEVVAKAEVKEEVVAKKEKKAPAAKPETRPRVKPVKTTLYDRNLDTHKSLIGRWLDQEFRNWNDASNLPKFAKASRALSGVAEFLDENGEVLESFKNSFREAVV